MPGGRDDQVDNEGIVVQMLPNAMFRVELTSNERILAHLSGERRRNFVRILVGDRVSVAISARNRTRGRITSRLG